MMIRKAILLEGRGLGVGRVSKHLGEKMLAKNCM